jgi:hypothetical protein
MDSRFIAVLLQHSPRKTDARSAESGCPDSIACWYTFCAPEYPRNVARVSPFRNAMGVSVAARRSVRYFSRCHPFLRCHAGFSATASHSAIEPGGRARSTCGRVWLIPLATWMNTVIPSGRWS